MIAKEDGSPAYISSKDFSNASDLVADLTIKRSYCELDALASVDQRVLILLIDYVKPAKNP
jgi:hypothetical protein